MEVVRNELFTLRNSPASKGHQRVKLPPSSIKAKIAVTAAAARNELFAQARVIVHLWHEDVRGSSVDLPAT